MRKLKKQFAIKDMKWSLDNDSSKVLASNTVEKLWNELESSTNKSSFTFVLDGQEGSKTNVKKSGLRVEAISAQQQAHLPKQQNETNILAPQQQQEHYQQEQHQQRIQTQEPGAQQAQPYPGQRGGGQATVAQDKKATDFDASNGEPMTEEQALKMTDQLKQQEKELCSLAKKLKLASENKSIDADTLLEGMVKSVSYSQQIARKALEELEKPIGEVCIIFGI